MTLTDWLILSAVRCSCWVFLLLWKRDRDDRLLARHHVEPRQKRQRESWNRHPSARPASTAPRCSPVRQQRREHPVVGACNRAVAAWFGDMGVIYASIIMTLLVVVFCEMLPKTAAINEPRPLRALGRECARLRGAHSRTRARRDGVARAPHAGIGPGHSRGGELFRAASELRGAVDLLHREGVSRSMIATCWAASSICATSPSPTS